MKDNQPDEVSNLLKPIDKVAHRLSVNSAFGEPVITEAATVIPVAEVRGFLGYGYGFGRAAQRREAAEQKEGDGSGGGGGGSTLGSVSPRGYIRIVGDAIEYVPIVNQGRNAMITYLLVAWLGYWFFATLRMFLRSSNR